MGSRGKDIPFEMQFLIVEGRDSRGQSEVYTVFLPILGDPDVEQFEGNHLVIVAAGPDPFDVITNVVMAVENHLQTFNHREKKKYFLSSEDFEPALILKKTIPIPDDKKPEDWDERAKIPDPEASKPDDWDEDALMEIKDAEAEKPEGWLNDKLEEIDDPEASKTEDWDDEEDGAWEPPMVNNPKCEAALGCACQVYLDVNAPLVCLFFFDNILIAADEKVVELYREATWKPKFEVENVKQKSEDEAAGISDRLAGFQKKVFDLLYKVADVPFLDAYKLQILDVIEKGEKQPNITIGVLIFTVILSIIHKILFGRKKPAKVVTEESKSTSKPSDTTDQGTSRAKEEEIDGVAAAPRRRNTKREN
ncbi:hypothetical protein GIB67_026448 [Kingdonia uniflora]|uniref:Calnexin n=1 Tax=Kingdonia uniflora TaxID=39325 RepID=A0A7J7P6I7_9MAGN|nr:hypothetical protein GIB67_026448 [Kingdonia uniflora]